MTQLMNQYIIAIYTIFIYTDTVDEMHLACNKILPAQISPHDWIQFPPLVLHNAFTHEFLYHASRVKNN